MGAVGTVKEEYGLFRPQALEAQRSARLGRVLINPPLAHTLIAIVAAALVATLFVLLIFVRYTPRIVAQGVLVSPQIARLRIPTAALAGLRPGLPARLSFAVYPYARLHPHGRVTAIDPVPVAGRGRNAFYAVQVRLDRIPGTATAMLSVGLPLRAIIARPARPLLRLFAGQTAGARVR